MSSSYLFLALPQALVLRLSLLFMLDAFAGAFVLQSLLSHWFFTKYHTKDVLLGSIIFMYVTRRGGFRHIDTLLRHTSSDRKEASWMHTLLTHINKIEWRWEKFPDGIATM